MSSQNSRAPFYPEIVQSNPEMASVNPNPNSSSTNLYPKIDMDDIVENLFPNLNHHRNDLPPDYSFYSSAPAYEETSSPTALPESTEELLIRIPGAILNLIDKEYSVELACGDLEIMVLKQDQKIVAVLARVADEVQWPLTKDGAAVKVDESHYFFSLNTSSKTDSDSSDEDEKRAKKSNLDQDYLVNYGLTIASKGQEGLLRQLDSILEKYSSFSKHSVSKKGKKGKVLESTLAKDTSPSELVTGNKKEIVEQSTAYWTTLAPNVEDYSGTAAKLIAAGSGQLIRGILWCGDVTVESLKRGNEILIKKMDPKENVQVSPKTMKRIKRAKKMTRMTEKVATGLLSGVVRVSGYVTSSVVNSSAGKKFFSMIPGEILLASLDGFDKVCDAVEVSGKNVMSTSSTVTTGLVSHRYGEEAGKATDEGFKTAGHAIGTAWAVYKIRKALNPKSSLKPTAVAKTAIKSAAAEAKAKKSSK